ncbi:MAG: (2Fe-2S)-binding protein [Firmicutes bacterium]|nr:(2Fe-2S)-binding protein [Bacillota bacterium]
MKPDELTIICRCEDLTRSRLRQLIGAGYTTFDEIKRISRAGMGPCQGRTCRALIEQEIAAMVGKPISEQPPTKFRQPSRPVTFAAILGGEPSEKNG